MIKIETQIDYFWSDPHFHHPNVIKFYPNRPGKTIEEHSEELINIWNSTVQPVNAALIAGDFAYKCKKEQVIDTISRMNGSIYFIRGNHDCFWFPNTESEKDEIRFQCKKYNIYFLDHALLKKQPNTKYGIHVSHYPCESWEGQERGSLHLHGHLHGEESKLKGLKRFDCGIDNIYKLKGSYNPLSWEDVLLALEK